MPFFTPFIQVSRRRDLVDHSDLFDPVIAAWWAAKQATAFAAGTTPAQPTSFDVTVSPRESLQAAIDRCREGGSVLLLPGSYEGGVILSKVVHLFGRGEATLWRAAGEGSVITSTAPVATLDGLIVRLGPHAEGERGHCGILITAGRLLVQHCDVSSKSRSSVIVEGASASPTILGCKVHGSAMAGIIFKGGSTGRVEGCSIVSNDQDGASICDGADPLLIANSIQDNKGMGVFISGGQGRLDRNCIRGNGRCGVWVEEEGDPTLSQNSIRSEGCGVFIHSTAIGNVLWGGGNRFSGNGADLGSDVWDDAESRPVHASKAEPVALSPADANLQRELECVVCKDIMLRPFSVCHHGHASTCMPCCSKLERCPICRGRLLSPPFRLRPLEGLAENLLVPCPHAADGCPHTQLRYGDAGVHVEKCDWRKVRPPSGYVRMHVPTLPAVRAPLHRSTSPLLLKNKIGALGPPYGSANPMHIMHGHVQPKFSTKCLKCVSDGVCA